ncbi:MAG: hypothetical protein SRB1_02822 [Desulfobacteraceae bacterium Eth-SRB1]|nr:MAG: hypothetical protein SRB1_02822 [Desulfobacteraceae bacterium Eth-SRB1]
MSSHDTKNPNGGVSMGHVIEPPDPNSNLLELVLSRDNMHLAWKLVKSNKGAPGVDDISIKEFTDNIRDKWEGIRESLMEGTYEPSPVLRVEIPKPTGGTRPLGIPTVLDRLIQQAITRVITPIFDPEFSDFSYGFRPGRSAHDAVFKVREYIRQGYRKRRGYGLIEIFRYHKLYTRMGVPLSPLLANISFWMILIKSWKSEVISLSGMPMTSSFW